MGTDQLHGAPVYVAAIGKRRHRLQLGSMATTARSTAAVQAESDAGPGVEPGAQRPERAVVRGHRAGSESDCCPEELAALVRANTVAALRHRNARTCQSRVVA
jgi:hypothetical protein